MDLSDKQPELTMIIGPAHSGKTEWGLRSVLAPEAGAAAIIVPTRREASAIREMLPVPVAGTGNVPLVLSAEKMASKILRDSSRWKSWNHAPITLEELILSRILSSERNGLGATTRAIPGLASSLLQRIHQWIRAGITPEMLTEIWESSDSRKDNPHASVRLEATTRIYALYVRYLTEQCLLSSSQAPALAAEQIKLNPELFAMKTVLYDGFDSLDSAQLHLLETICRFPGCNVYLTLCSDDSRPDVFASALQVEKQIGHRIKVNKITLHQNGTNRSAVATISWHYGRQIAPELPDNPVKVAELEDAHTMAEEALRWADSERRNLGCAANQVAVITRGGAPVLSALIAAAERTGIPLACPGHRRPLTANPLIQATVAALQLFRSNWQTSDLLVLLRSPCLRIGIPLADRLRVMAQQNGLLSGRTAWQNFLLTLPAEFAECSSVVTRLIKLDERLNQGSSNASAAAECVLDIPSALEMEARLQMRSSAAARSGRHCQRLMSVLLRQHALLRIRATELAAFATALTTHQYIDEVCALLGHATYSEHAGQEAILLLNATSMHACNIRACAIVGFDDRTWPQLQLEDPYLRDSELHMLQAGPSTQNLSSNARASREALIAYFALTSSSEKLAIFYSRRHGKGEAGPSPWLKLLEQCVPCQPYHTAAPVAEATVVVPPADLAECATSERNRFSIQELEDQQTCPFLRMMRYDADLSTCNPLTSWRIQADSNREGLLRAQVTLPAVDTPKNRHLRSRDAALSQLRLASDVREYQRAEQVGCREFKVESQATRFELKCGDANEITLEGTWDRLYRSTRGNILVQVITASRRHGFGCIARVETLTVLLQMAAYEQTHSAPAAAACEHSVRSGNRTWYARARFTEATKLHADLNVTEASGAHHITREAHSEMSTQAIAAALRAVDAIRSGSSEPLPGPHCRYCGVGSVCRSGIAWLESKGR